MKASITILAAVFLAAVISSNAEIYVIGELDQQADVTQCTTFHSVNFEEIDKDNPLPWSIYDGILDLGKMHFAERFEGQTVNKTSGYDIIEGYPTNPLTLRPGKKGQNLAVYYNHLNDGSALNGLGPKYSTGKGSISGFVDDDLVNADLEIITAEKFDGNLFVRGFRKDGSITNDFLLTSVDFLWYDSHGIVKIGMDNIAGFSIHSNNTGRIYLDNVNMCDSNTHSPTASPYPSVFPTSYLSPVPTRSATPTYFFTELFSGNTTESLQPSLSLMPSTM